MGCRLPLSKGGTNLDKNHTVSLYDELGTEYQRRNQYLSELMSLKQQLREAEPAMKPQLSQRLSELRKNRNQNPYIIALNRFRAADQKFRKDLSVSCKAWLEQLDARLPRQVKTLKIEIHKAEQRREFYAAYRELSWDAELIYRQSELELRQLPELVEYYLDANDALQQARKAMRTINQNQLRDAADTFRRQKTEERRKYAAAKKALKAKYAAGLISAKALGNGRIELKKKMQEANLQHSFTIEKKALQDVIVNKKYLLTKGFKRKTKILNSNISDIRRRTPVEPDLQFPCYALAGMLIPGLGQLLNKQYIKAAFFSLASLYVYLVAIPYALGYGNFQGKGISGLVTLAQGARRIDKSAIFMIEGIIAILMVLIAVTLLLINFRDVDRTQKAGIRGIRPRNWFETTVGIENDGFPYLVSLPALIVTLFIVIVPITTAILLSFTGMDPQNQSKFPWIGLTNYITIALGRGLAGSVFWLILGWTLIWTAASTSLAILTGFGLALIANQERIKGKAFFRTVYLLPWAVPAFITIMFFSIMFAPNGALTAILEALFQTRIHIKNDPNLSRITLILLQAWLGSSYVFLLATGVLQAIPGDLYEAAQIDGASSWQKLFKITIPIVLFQTAPLLVGQYTFNFNNFSIIYLFNGGGPFNPIRYGNLAGTTDLLISYIFKLTMQNQYQAIGAAITIVISLGLMVFAYIGFKNSKAFKEERL